MHDANIFLILVNDLAYSTILLMSWLILSLLFVDLDISLAGRILQLSLSL